MDRIKDLSLYGKLLLLVLVGYMMGLNIGT